MLALHRAGVTKGEILKEIPIQRRTMDRWIVHFALKSIQNSISYQGKRAVLRKSDTTVL